MEILRRLKDLQRRPIVALALIAGASAVLRTVAALQIHTPLYYPDEWIYTALSRSFVHGSFGHVRGASVPVATTISYFGPLVTSPVWLIHNVAVAYHLAQAIASIAFATAAFATYALARRVGVGTGGALIAALLALLIPSAAFTSTLLAEPYAYTFFILATLAAVEAIAAPSVRWVAAATGLGAGLCVVGGFQFLYFIPVCLAAYLLVSPSLHSAGKRLLLLALLGSIGVATLHVVGNGLLARVIATARSEHYPVSDLAAWFGLNSFVLAVASGWVIVPGAVMGLRSMVVDRNGRARAFGVLAILLVVTLLAEAAVWGANGQGLYERYSFYGTPLLAIAFARSIEAAGPRFSRALYAAIAYAGAVAAILLPLSSRLVDNVEQSPTLLGLAAGLILNLHSPPLIWAPIFALLAAGTALVGPRHSQALTIIASCVCVVTSAAGMRALVDQNDPVVPTFNATAGAAYLTNPNESRYSVMKNLFWSPHIRRVVVLGASAFPDGLRSLEGRLTASSTIVTTAGGAPIPGPFVVGTGTFVRSRQHVLAHGEGLAQFPNAPALIAFGWYGRSGYLAPFGQIFVAAGEGRGYRVVLRLTSLGPERTVIMLKCVNATEKSAFVVTPSGSAISIPVRRHSAQNCRFGLGEGKVRTIDGHSVIARAVMSLRP